MSKKRKKSDKELKRDRQISRDKRNALRRSVKDNTLLNMKSDVFQIIFISKETDNMEKILFSVNPISDEYLLDLPIITSQMINECEDKTPKGLILYYFGIESDNIEKIDGTNLIVVKDFSAVNNIQNLKELIVRQYYDFSWYDNNCTTTLFGRRIFKGKKLKDFFFTKNNLNNFVIFQDTLSKIILYRIKANKISENEFTYSYFGSNQFKRNNSIDFRPLGINRATLREQLRAEKRELFELLNDDDSPARKLNLNRCKAICSNNNISK